MLQAERTVWSSLMERERPRVVVASTVTTIKVGPSRIDFNGVPTELLVLCAMSLILSIGPSPIINTVFA